MNWVGYDRAAWDGLLGLLDDNAQTAGATANQQGGARLSRYFDPDGKPLTMEQWAKLLERTAGNDDSWWRKQTWVGDVHVSTVWLGLDHSFGDGEPLFWETMTFPGGPGGDLTEGYSNRYSSKDAALADHDRVVSALRDGRDPEEAA